LGNPAGVILFVGYFTTQINQGVIHRLSLQDNFVEVLVITPEVLPVDKLCSSNMGQCGMKNISSDRETPLG
jgi:hypothetical protein